MIRWDGVQTGDPKEWTCFACGREVASATGWNGADTGNRVAAHIRICPRCAAPTYFNAAGRPIPQVDWGTQLRGIEDVALANLWDEARSAFGAGAYTAVVLTARKILMHIAVDHGADAGMSFVAYVAYLADEHHIPPKATPWVEEIRRAGNEANHEINLSDHDGAERLMTLLQAVLNYTYEIPAALNPPPAAPEN